MFQGTPQQMMGSQVIGPQMMGQQQMMGPMGMMQGPGMQGPGMQGPGLHQGPGLPPAHSDNTPRDDMSHVHKGIWIGSHYVLKTAKFLNAKGIKHVINTAIEFITETPELINWEELKQNGITVHNTYWDDTITQVIYPSKSMTVALSKIGDYLGMGDQVFINCAMGKSRSCSLVMAYLIAREGMDYETALAAVKSGRPQCQPNPNFEKQLRLLESHVRSGQLATGPIENGNPNVNHIHNQNQLPGSPLRTHLQAWPANQYAQLTQPFHNAAQVISPTRTNVDQGWVNTPHRQNPSPHRVSHFQADLGPQYASLLSAPMAPSHHQSASPHRVHHGHGGQVVSPHRYSASPVFQDEPAVILTSPGSQQPTSAYDQQAPTQFLEYTQPIYEEPTSDKHRIARKLKHKFSEMVHGENPVYRTQNPLSPQIELGMSPAYPLSSTDYDDALGGYTNTYAHPYQPSGGNARRAFKSGGSGDVYTSDAVVDPLEVVDGWRLTA